MGAGFGKNGAACFDNFCGSLGDPPSIYLERMHETNVVVIVENITSIHKFGTDHINNCCYHCRKYILIYKFYVDQINGCCYHCLKYDLPS